MSDLVDFLRAQLDEDERVARGAHGGWGPHHWRYDEQHREVLYGNITIYGERDPHGYHTTTAGHLLRHDPARVLAEVEARRRILDEHNTGDWKIGDRVHDCQWHEWPCATLRLLALPYADRPGFREEWRPPNG